MSVRRIGSGPHVVWIHGLGESSTSFDPVVAGMPGFTHVLPDWWGVYGWFFGVAIAGIGYWLLSMVIARPVPMAAGVR